MEWVLVGVAVFAGAFLQRLSGIGFALVASPLLVLVLGPVQGVVVTNVIAVVTALAVAVFHLRVIEYRRVLPLLSAAAVGVVPGSLLVQAAPPAVLLMTTGTLILLGLALGHLSRTQTPWDRYPALVGAGLASGAMNVIAGAGGPAAAAYSTWSGWDHRRFVISIQFYFAILGSISLLVRHVPPAMTAAEWAAAATALIAGLGVARAARNLIDPHLARRLCTAVAVAGGVAVIIRGAADALC